jgi:hypothetical protein
MIRYGDSEKFQLSIKDKMDNLKKKLLNDLEYKLGKWIEYHTGIKNSSVEDLKKENINILQKASFDKTEYTLFKNGVEIGEPFIVTYNIKDRINV